MSSVTKPILLDETGQAIVSKLVDIKDAIINKLPAGDPVRITVVSPPTKTEYSIGETLDLTGITVCAIFSNNAVIDITDQCTYDPAEGQIATGDAINITWVWYPTEQTFSASTPISVEYVTWADGTDAQVKGMLDAHYAGLLNIYDYWAVGDERVVSLSAMSAMSPLSDTHVQQNVTFVLANEGGKELTTPINDNDECAFTVIMKTRMSDDLYSYYHSSISAPGVGWKDCDRRTWCNTTFRNALPETAVSIFKQHKNISVKGGEDISTSATTDDYFAYPAGNEIVSLHDKGWESDVAYSIESQSTQLAWTNVSANRSGLGRIYTRTCDIRDGDTVYILDYRPDQDSFYSGKYNGQGIYPLVVGAI